MSKAITASPVPLFDRLTGAEHASSADGRLQGGGALQQSLQRDLLRLFNVRNSLTIQEYLTDDLTVLHFGLPDMLALTAQSEQDLATWSSVLRRALALFESRLSQVQIHVFPDPDKPYAAQATIAAAVMLGQQLCRVNFAVALDASSAELKAAA